MNRFTAILAVFRKGAMVADPTSWKNIQLAVNAIVGFLVALAILAESMGWLPVGITNDISAVVLNILVALAGANIAGTAATSKKVGVGSKPPMPEPDDAELWDSPDPVQAEREAVAKPKHPGKQSGADRSRQDWLGD